MNDVDDRFEIAFWKLHYELNYNPPKVYLCQINEWDHGFLVVSFVELYVLCGFCVVLHFLCVSMCKIICLLIDISGNDITCFNVCVVNPV